MAGALARFRERVAREDGYTLTELLAAMTVSLVVAAGAAMMVSMAVTSQPGTTERAGQLQQGRVMLETFTRELRQGESILSGSATGLELLTYVPTATCGGAATGGARLCRVSYSCEPSSCTRTEGAPDGTGTPTTRTMVEGITGPNAFKFEGDPLDPSYVGVQLVFAQRDGSEAVTLEDGATLRNHIPAAEAAS